MEEKHDTSEEGEEGELLRRVSVQNVYLLGERMPHISLMCPRWEIDINSAASRSTVADGEPSGERGQRRNMCICNVRRGEEVKKKKKTHTRLNYPVSILPI